VLPDEVVVVSVTELSVVVVVISPVVVDPVTPDVVVVGSAVPDPEQASWSLSDRLIMLG